MAAAGGGGGGGDVGLGGKMLVIRFIGCIPPAARLNPTEAPQVNVQADRSSRGRDRASFRSPCTDVSPSRTVYRRSRSAAAVRRTRRAIANGFDARRDMRRRLPQGNVAASSIHRIASTAAPGRRLLRCERRIKGVAADARLDAEQGLAGGDIQGLHFRAGEGQIGDHVFGNRNAAEQLALG